MSQRRLGYVGTVLFLLGTSVHCGGSDSTESSNAGDENTGGEEAGKAGDEVPPDGDTEDPTPVNQLCPNAVVPKTGLFAEKGACCYRGNSNTFRLANAEDGLFDLTYRVNFAFPSNHPASLSLNALRGLAVSRHQNQEQSLLIRMSVPVKDGELQSGEGELTIGQGGYNCDGTYSFYTDGTAPAREGFTNSDDSGRWTPTTVKATFSTDEDGAAAFSVAFEDEGDDLSYTPFMIAEGNSLALDWEIVTRTFDISKWSWDDLDCVGSFNTRTKDWEPGDEGEYTFYATLAENMEGDNGINALGNIHLAQLVAFGLDGGNATQPLDPLSETRCTPGETDCKWKKLPDSLCPTTAEEEAIFRCHIGDENNEKETANCSATAPTTPRNEDAPDEGQCCDPLGQSDTLPACNAYLVRNPFVAASAEITDAPTSEMFTGCE